MSLDMYVRQTQETVEAPIDFDLDYEKTSELFYWRKHPNLHGWMEGLYRKKGGQDEQFNLSNVQLTSEDLDKLEEDIKSRSLPHTTGFFFGESYDNEEQDLRFIEEARQALEDGYFLYYTSWW